MLDDLLENGIIELPAPKRPEEAGRITDPKYCRYHRVISHPLKKCITLKECIMQLARDGRIILDLDDPIRTNHISAQLEHYLPSVRQSSSQTYGQEKTDVSSSQREDVFTIQFGSLEPVVVPVAAQRLTLETSLASDDGEGWTVVTRQKPRKPKQTQAPPLRRKKRQGKKKNPRHARSKKRSKTNKRQKIQPIDLLEQKPLGPVTLKEFFPMDFFYKVTANMTSCYEMEEDGEEDEEKLEKPSKRGQDSDNVRSFICMHKLETNPHLARRSTSACCCCLAAPRAQC